AARAVGGGDQAGAGVREHRGPAAVRLVEQRLAEWADAGELPTRVVALDGGRVVADGPAERVWRRVGADLARAGAHLPWPVEARPGRSPGGDPPPPAPAAAASVEPGATLLRATRRGGEAR